MRNAHWYSLNGLTRSSFVKGKQQTLRNEGSSLNRRPHIQLEKIQICWDYQTKYHDADAALLVFLPPTSRWCKGKHLWLSLKLSRFVCFVSCDLCQTPNVLHHRARIHAICSLMLSFNDRRENVNKQKPQVSFYSWTNKRGKSKNKVAKLFSPFSIAIA